MQFFVGAFKEPADIPASLTQPLFVFHQPDTDIVVSVLAETEAGRNGDLGMLEQQLGEFQAAQRLELFRNRCPDEHARLRRGNFPARAAESVDHDITTLLVNRAGLADAVVGTIERSGRGNLDRRECTVVQVGLHPGESRNQAIVASASPAWKTSWTGM